MGKLYGFLKINSLFFYGPDSQTSMRYVQSCVFVSVSKTCLDDCMFLHLVSELHISLPCLHVLQVLYSCKTKTHFLEFC